MGALPIASSRIAGQAARNASASSSVSTSGGASRIRSGVGLLTMKPCAERGRRRPRPSVGSARSRPISRPAPRDLGHPRVGREPGAEPLAERGRVLEQAVLLDGRRCTASAAAQATGLPPKVVPWLPGWSRSPRVADGDAGADRDAAGQALGQRDDVGATTPGRRAVGEPGAGAADAGLHLVEPQQRAVLVGDLAGGREVAVGRDDDAGLALDRLEHDGGGLVGDRGGQRVGVAVRARR